MPHQPSPLQRLYKTKFALLATVSAALGLGLLFWARWAAQQPGWLWLNNLPANEIGSSLFFAGLFGILFQYVGQRDAEELTAARLRHVLAEEAPAIRNAVVRGFAFEPDSLTDVASPAVLDRVIENCLAIRLDDSQLAREAYADLREQVVRAARLATTTVCLRVRGPGLGNHRGVGFGGRAVADRLKHDHAEVVGAQQVECDDLDVASLAGVGKVQAAAFSVGVDAYHRLVPQASGLFSRRTLKTNPLGYSGS